MSKKQSKLLDLLQEASPARRILQLPEVDLGLAEIEPFPFLALVGQQEMKLALLLSIINPLIGGVLLIGSRGTAKTTAVRSLTDLLPRRKHSVCPHGCTEELLDQFGMDAICKDCTRRIGYGEPLTVEDRVRMVELPLNARIDDVVGHINERLALEQQRLRLEKGILAQADGNILYIDEVNLLEDVVTDAILDAASQGFYSVRRGPINFQYRARFVLIGSMNPEEGSLRPQIMDRFGLRVVVRGLPDKEMRFQAYQQSLIYKQHPERLSAAYAEHTLALAEEVNQAKERLPRVAIGDEARELGLSVIAQMEIDSGRAEITLFEAARAHAAADEREEVQPADIDAVLLMSLRLRHSPRLSEFFSQQDLEDQRLRALMIDRQEGAKKKDGGNKKSSRS